MAAAATRRGGRTSELASGHDVPKAAQAARPQLAAQVIAGWPSGGRRCRSSGRLRVEFPQDPMMWVSHETIYQALYMQGRGELRRELASCLRTGRAKRRRHGRHREHRSDPRHGDDQRTPGRGRRPGCPRSLGRGSADRRQPEVRRRHSGRTDQQVRAAAASARRPATRTWSSKPCGEAIGTLPAELARSITWDQGKEMAHHADFTIATGIPVYFCDPHKPWQRGSNENTNGLLRQYLPKGTDLSVHYGRRPGPHSPQPQRQATQDPRFHDTIKKSSPSSLRRPVEPAPSIIRWD